jgi:hypothetical protein
MKHVSWATVHYADCYVTGIINSQKAAVRIPVPRQSRISRKPLHKEFSDRPVNANGGVSFLVQMAFQKVSFDSTHSFNANKYVNAFSPDNTACPHPGTPTNGVLLATDLSIGQNVSYNCKPGYTLIGAPVRYCQDIEQWTGSLPECLSEYIEWYLEY